MAGPGATEVPAGVPAAASGETFAEVPLVVTADGNVREHVARLAAAVGCRPRFVDDLEEARSFWSTAPLVIIDEVPDEPTVPRRPGVFLVRTSAPTQGQWKAAVELGVHGVAILPDDEDAVVTALADVAERPSAKQGRVIAVVGGRGGAGASVLAASLALTAAASGDAALLVDCDPSGGGVDLLLGAEADDGLRWPDLRISSGRVAMSELDAALPSRRRGRGRVSIVSCDRSGSGPAGTAVAAVLQAGRRAGRTVVCDLPRYPDEAADEALRHADLTVLVVPAEVRSCVAATRVCNRLALTAGCLAVVGRARRGGSLSEGDLAEAVGAPVIGWIRDEGAVARALDHGALRPGRRLGRVATAVLAAAAEVLAA